MPQREQWKISLPPDLARRVDELREDTGESRSRFVERGLEMLLSAYVPNLPVAPVPPIVREPSAQDLIRQTRERAGLTTT
jgi:hypothetical protein